MTLAHLSAVRYAEPLIDYDQVVAFEPKADYLVVIAGPAHIDRSAGEAVLAGKKLGGPLPTSDKIYLNRRPGLVRSGRKRSI